ncbi:MAG: hypothetical protein J6A05_00500, partial [Oscillospiraceae bacterium]|nr:hypothetical protein [Oscillospiraceae bacterium]
MNSFEEVFQNVQEYCTNKIKNGELSDTAYRLWINTLQPVKLDENVACFTVSSEFQANIIKKNYTAIIKEALESVLGFEVDIDITAMEEVIDDEEDTDPYQLKKELEESFTNAE